jgi:hypothetical protein
MEYLKAMGLISCLFSGLPITKEESVEVFPSYSHFINKKPSFVSKKHIETYSQSEGCVFDEILKEYFSDRKATMYDADFNEITVAQSHVTYKADHGQCYISQVARRKKVYSVVPTNFYSYGHAPKDWPVPEGDTFGIEIEMLLPSVQNKLKFSSWVGQTFPGWVCEYDGSLEDHGNADDCGLELISPPLLFEDICEKATIICEKAVELGGKGFQAGIFYGMHVTVQVPKGLGRTSPSRTLIGSRYIAFFNLPKLRPFWQLVARRKGDSFLTYCPFKDISLDNCLSTERGQNDRHPHRRAVFVRNPTLLETRVFRSNLSAIQVRSNIEICKLVMEFCQSKEFDMDNLSVFYNYLHKHMSKDLKACLYRKKNTPIRLLNEIVMESEIEKEPEATLSY